MGAVSLMVACVMGAVLHLSHSLMWYFNGVPPTTHTQPLVGLLLHLWVLWLSFMRHNLLKTSNIHKL